mgnify:CR=1 FL=1
MMIVASVMLVVITFIKGMKIDENPMFIAFESLINLCILVDYIIRVYLAGFKRFFKNQSLWNIFDSVVVMGCVLLFVVMLLSRTGVILVLEEISEELLLVVWSVFQTLRMIIFAKKQRQA